MSAEWYRVNGFERDEVASSRRRAQQFTTIALYTYAAVFFLSMWLDKAEDVTPISAWFFVVPLAGFMRLFYVDWQVAIANRLRIRQYRQGFAAGKAEDEIDAVLSPTNQRLAKWLTLSAAAGLMIFCVVVLLFGTFVVLAD